MKTIHCFGKGFLLYFCQGHWMHKSRESTGFERKQLSCFLRTALLGLRRVREFSWHCRTVKYNWKYFSYICRFEISTICNGSCDTQEIVMDNKSVCPRFFPKVSLLQRSHCEVSVLQSFNNRACCQALWIQVSPFSGFFHFCFAKQFYWAIQSACMG